MTFSAKSNDSDLLLKSKESIEDFTTKVIEYVTFEPNDIDSTIFRIESVQNIFKSLHGDSGKPFLKEQLETAKDLKRKSQIIEEDIEQRLESNEEETYSEVDYENLPDYYWLMEYESDEND